MNALRDAATRFADITRSIAEKEAELKTLKATERDLAENVLPELIEDDQFTMDLGNGRTLVIGEEFHLNPPESRGEAATDWLRAAGHADALVTEIRLAIPKKRDGLGQELLQVVEDFVSSINRAEADEMNALIAEVGMIRAEATRAIGARFAQATSRLTQNVAEHFMALMDDGPIPEEIATTSKTTINGSTLRSLLLKRRRAGQDFPEDLFGAYIARKASIIEPKAKTIEDGLV